MTSTSNTVLIAAFCLSQALASREARAVPPGYAVEIVHGGLSFPVALRFAPDGRLFYLERDGRIMACADSGLASPFEWARVPTYVFLESGLLGLDFHPDFPDSPYVYVFHTPSSGIGVVARLTDVGGSGVDYATLYANPSGHDIHVAGRIAFGLDRMLYLTSGDGHVSNEAPLVTSLKGKLLRLTTMGEPAPGNPWPENPVVAAIGLRNAFGLCFDRADGTGYLTENADGACDELDLVTLGANYGWPPSTPCGPPAAGTQFPLAVFPSIAPTGCCVYRGAAYPEFAGDLFFGTWYGDVRRATFHPGSRTVLDSVVVFHQFWIETHQRVTDVTVGPDGLLWITTADGGGSIWRVVPQRFDESSDLRRRKAPPNPFVRHVHPGAGPPKY